MGVSLYYRGLLDDEYTLEEFVAGVVELASERGFRARLSFRPERHGVYVCPRFKESETLNFVFPSIDHPLVLSGNTKTCYEYGPKGKHNHKGLLEFLQEVNKKYFKGKMDIKDEEKIVS